MGNLDYRALAVLDALASNGSFETAALALGSTPAAVSQRLKTLENDSGRLLLVRGQPLVPTGLGRRLIAHYRNVKLMEAALDIDLGHQTSLPHIALAIDAASLATWLRDCLPPLLTPPRCQLELRPADSETALRLLRQGAVFGCVASAPEAPEAPDAAATLTVTPLGLRRHVCVATPVFAGHWFGDGFSAPAARLAPAAGAERRLLARLLDEQLDLRGPFPQHTLPAGAALDDCILGGLAYGLLPHSQAAAALADGRLLDLLPGRTLDEALNWHAWPLDTPFTRLLSEQIVTTARHHLARDAS